MTPCVVDASVVAKWFLDEEHSLEARKILQRQGVVHAPDLLFLEMDSIFCKRIRRGDLCLADAAEARRMLPTLPVRLHPSWNLRDLAFGLALDSRRGFYDCLYWALAVRLDGQVVTADRRFAEGLPAGPLTRHVAWIGTAR